MLGTDPIMCAHIMKLSAGRWNLSATQRRGDEGDEPKDVVVEPNRVHEQEAEAHQPDHRDGAATYEDDLPHRHRRFVLRRHGEAPGAVDEVHDHRADLVREHDRSDRAAQGARAIEVEELQADLQDLREREDGRDGGQEDNEPEERDRPDVLDRRGRQVLAEREELVER